MSAVLIVSCDIESSNSAGEMQQEKTAEMLQEANNQIGMPAIVNFQEKKLMKQIYELRDKEDLVCFFEKYMAS